MSHRYYKVATTVVAMAVMSSMAFAEDAKEDGALGMRVGAGNRLVLTLESSLLFTDNAYYQDSGKTSSGAMSLRPGLYFTSDHGDLRYQLSGTADATAFTLDSDKDDYVDSRFDGTVWWAPLTQHRFQAGAYLSNSHDPFGSKRTEATPSTINTKLDRWQEDGGNIIYRFGAPEAKINLEAELAALDHTYDTNRSFTKFLDYDAETWRGTAFYRISPKTQVLAEVLGADINYDHVALGFPTRAGDLRRYRVGAHWLATGKTTGDLRVGKVKRDFDSSLQPNYNEFDWAAAMTWFPRARDMLQLSTGREPTESYLNAASLIDHRYVNLSWGHDWTSRVKTVAKYGFSDDDFRGIGRTDKVNKFTLGAEYRATLRWTTYAELSHENRDSNFSARDYDVNVFVTGIKLAY